MRTDIALNCGVNSPPSGNSFSWYSWYISTFRLWSRRIVAGLRIQPWSPNIIRSSALRYLDILS